jgi:hypothetical protein
MKYRCSLFFLFCSALFMVSCGWLSFLTPPPTERQVDYVTIYAKTQNLPKTVRLDRIYVTDDTDAQIGAGAGYSGTGTVTLNIPSDFVGKELNVCTGFSLLTYASTRVVIAEGITAVISAEDISVGVPGGVLPEIPNVISSYEVVVSTSVIGISGYEIKDIYVTSYEGGKISTAEYNKSTHKWMLNMPDAMDGSKLRFWVDYEHNGKPYGFYDDIVWRATPQPTNINISYVGKVVANSRDLQGLGSAGTGDHFVITNAISVSAAPWNPLDSFQGVLHGGGHKISGIRFDQSGGNSYGLFRSLAGAVYDLRLEYAQTTPLVISAVNVSSQAMVGILAGEAVAGSEIQNVSVTLAGGVSTFSVRAALSGTFDFYLGGVVGYLNGGTISQTSCGTKVELAPGGGGSGKHFIGGLAGRSSGQISDSYTYGVISASSAVTGTGSVYAGGLAGLSSSAIDRSYAVGNVLAENNAATVTVMTGGLVGYAENGYQINSSAAKIKNVRAGNGTAGTLLGSESSVTGDNNNKRRYDMQLQGGTSHDMQGVSSTLSSAAEWPFPVNGVLWSWDIADSLPKFYWQQSSTDILDIFDALNLGALLKSSI